MTITYETAERLARQGCGMPNCGHDHGKDPFYLHARCHVGGRLHARYVAGTGYLEILCGECERPVGRVPLVRAEQN